MTVKFVESRLCVVAVIARLLVFLSVGGVLFAHGGVSNGISNGATDLIELKDDNWQLMLKGEWMVEFFAPWCPACKNLAPTWERFATAASDGLQVNVAKIDVTTSPSLSGRFFVTALPTIYHVKDGEFRQYRGSRDGDALMLFLKQQQWQHIEPISSWKKPDTLHMSILSYFFKLSHTLKDFNGRLQEEYGLPTWGSYALLAISTIFIGAALGLLLVCVVDFLYPPKKSQRQSFSEVKEKCARDDNIEDLANDEIEDEDEDDNNRDDDEDEEDEDEGDDGGDEEEAPELVQADEDEEDEDDDDDEEEEDEEDDDEAASTASETEAEQQSKKQQQKQKEKASSGVQETTGGGKETRPAAAAAKTTPSPPKSGKAEQNAAPADTKKDQQTAEPKERTEEKATAAATGGGDVRKRRARKAD